MGGRPAHRYSTADKVSFFIVAALASALVLYFLSLYPQEVPVFALALVVTSVVARTR